MGCVVGEIDGLFDDTTVGWTVGLKVGVIVGVSDGSIVGIQDSILLGHSEDR